VTTVVGPDGPTVALTVAGSDSGAGAGVQADLKTMSALGVLATTAVTAVTAQDTVAVHAVHPIPPELVAAQLDAVLGDLPVAAVKTGMLASGATVETVARYAAAGRLPRLVVDPVLVASSGRPLLDAAGVEATRRALLPHALVVTPNLVEAAVLCEVDPASPTGVDDLTELARQVLSLGPRWVLVTGGHLPGVDLGAEADGPTVRVRADPPTHVPDVLCHATGVWILDGPRVATSNTHGTGCSLSAALCAGLALGLSVPAAAEQAKRYVARALTGAAHWRLGRGRTPLDHAGAAEPLPGPERRAADGPPPHRPR
jgi:hydroxymethylpyrimidine/phosphomethylpyrimidine kinase